MFNRAIGNLRKQFSVQSLAAMDNPKANTRELCSQHAITLNTVSEKPTSDILTINKALIIISLNSYKLIKDAKTEQDVLAAKNQYRIEMWGDFERNNNKSTVHAADKTEIGEQYRAMLEAIIIIKLCPPRKINTDYYFMIHKSQLSTLNEGDYVKLDITDYIKYSNSQDPQEKECYYHFFKHPNHQQCLTRSGLCKIAQQYPLLMLAEYQASLAPFVRLINLPLSDGYLLSINDDYSRILHPSQSHLELKLQLTLCKQNDTDIHPLKTIYCLNADDQLVVHAVYRNGEPVDDIDKDRYILPLFPECDTLRPLLHVTIIADVSSGFPLVTDIRSNVNSGKNAKIDYALHQEKFIEDEIKEFIVIESISDSSMPDSIHRSSLIILLNNKMLEKCEKDNLSIMQYKQHLCKAYIDNQTNDSQNIFLPHITNTVPNRYHDISVKISLKQLIESECSRYQYFPQEIISRQQILRTLIEKYPLLILCIEQAAILECMEYIKKLLLEISTTIVQYSIDRYTMTLDDARLKLNMHLLITNTVTQQKTGYHFNDQNKLICNTTELRMKDALPLPPILSNLAELLQITLVVAIDSNSWPIITDITLISA